MGYVTLNLSRAHLLDGMYIDQGTEQHRERGGYMPVTLHEEDLKRGTFVTALKTNDGHLTPFTWKSDMGDYRATALHGVYTGGTLEQFVYKCQQQAALALVHRWAPTVAVHVPRED